MLSRTLSRFPWGDGKVRAGGFFFPPPLVLLCLPACQRGSPPLTPATTTAIPESRSRSLACPTTKWKEARGRSEWDRGDDNGDGSKIALLEREKQFHVSLLSCRCRRFLSPLPFFVLQADTEKEILDSIYRRHYSTYTKKRRRNIMHKKINYKSAPYTHPPQCQNKIKKRITASSSFIPVQTAPCPRFILRLKRLSTTTRSTSANSSSRWWRWCWTHWSARRSHRHRDPAAVPGATRSSKRPAR